MSEKERLKIMIALAMYESKYGKKDMEANDHYESDYIYKRNSVTRVLVFLGFLIVLLFYILHLFLMDEETLFSMDIKSAVITAGIILCALMVFYTLLGWRIYGREYENAIRRVENCFMLMDELNKDEDR
ncbi:MAG: hypothetical protein IJC39_04540 [Firmicutes bacterium]|nr:hypothetical protein [Bacillota bacterium]